MLTCGSCGATSPAGAKFCMECGERFSPPGSPGEARKVVTAVFCDVVGSTALGESRDPETLRSVMTQYFATMREVLERHGGTVEKFIGDAVMAVFGVPVVHEDDALRAVRAALEMQAALERLNERLQETRGLRLGIRIGVNTGEVVVGDGASGTVATGDAINVAARLEQAAGLGEVLLGAATHEVVRDAVTVQDVPPLAVKGKAEPLPAWRAIAVSSRPRAVARDAPLIGRDREMTLLRHACEQSVATRSCHLVTVLGAPGVGKTRLVDELVEGLGPEARVLRGRCPSYGDIDGLWPLVEVVRAASGLTGLEDADGGRAAIAAVVGDAADASRVVAGLAPLVGLGGTPAEPDETRWAVRRLVEAVAASQPLVVVLDDVHWASPLLLDLVDHLADWVVDRPVVLLCVARPELLEVRPGWGGGKVFATTTALQPLDAAASDALVTALVAASDVRPALRAQVLAAAEGVPLFVEQMVAMLADGPADGPADGRPVVPPTIAALLAARLERLPEAERSLLGRAAVMGHEFRPDGLVELSGLPGPEVSAATNRLVRKEFLRPAVAHASEGGLLGFRHVLVRDAAYATLPKGVRADLHERFSRWLDRSGTRDHDNDRFAVHHLAEAVRLRDELGPRDAATQDRAEEAARRLSSTARTVADIDPVAAGRMLDDAADLLPVAGVVKAELLLTRSQVLGGLGDGLEVRERLAAARAAAALAEELGDDRLGRLARLRVEPLELRFGIEADHGLERSREELARFEEAGDDEGVLIAAQAVLDFLHMNDRWDDMAAVGDALLPVAERCGADGVVRVALGAAVSAALRGSCSLDRAFAVLDRVLARTSSRPLRVRVIETEAMLRVLAGDDAAAAAALRRADELYDSLGVGRDVVADAFFRGELELARDDPAAAAERLEPGIAELESAGESGYASNLYAMLSDARARLGDLAGAREALARARALTADGDVSAQCAWRVAQVAVELADGSPAEAVRCAREAVEISDAGQTIDAKAESRILLARALAAAGSRQEAGRAYAEARALLVARGAGRLLVRLDAETAALGP